MTVALLVIAGAIVTGYLRGGSIHGLARVSLPGWPLVVAALVVQALGAFAAVLGARSPHAWYVAGMVASAALVSVFVVRNRQLPGMPLVAVGFLLNATVVVANGAMPVSTEAAERAGITLSALHAGTDAKHELLDGDSRLTFLADVIPVPLPLVPIGSNVLSAGDIVLAAGIGILVTNGMLFRS